MIDEQFTEAYKLYFPEIYCYIKRKGVIESSAEDLTQTVFFNIMMTKTENIKNIRAYLYNVARKEIARYYLEKKKGICSLELVENVLFYENNNALSYDVKVAVMRLPIQERKIILLKYQGYNSKEIGIILKMKSGTVRSRLNSIRKKLSSLR